MRDKIKGKKKSFAKAQKAQRLKDAQKAPPNRKHLPSVPSPPVPKPKVQRNAYAKREIQLGKKVEPKIEKQKIEKTKMKKNEPKPKASCSVSTSSSEPVTKIGRVVNVSLKCQNNAIFDTIFWTKFDPLNDFSVRGSSYHL